MGYPIDGDDDFLIKLLFRLFGKTISVIFLRCSCYLNKMQGHFFMSVSRLKVLFDELCNISITRYNYGTTVSRTSASEDAG